MEPLAPERPLSRAGKVLLALMLLELLVIWSLGIHAYFTLPEVVPTHFDFSGKPTSYGEKVAFLIIPVAFSIAPVILLAITLFRFTLVNKYPYFINLPAFYTRITKLPFEMRGEWVNKYFEAVFLFGCALTIVFILLEFEIFRGAMTGSVASSLTFVVMQIALFALIGLFIHYIYYLRMLSSRLQRVTN